MPPIPSYAFPNFPPVALKFAPPAGWSHPEIKVRLEKSDQSQLNRQLDRFRALFPTDDLCVHYLNWVCETVLSALYGHTPWAVPKQVRTLTWVVREFDGLAHACGSDEDKEIHFSLNHLAGCNPDQPLKHDDFSGIMIHEVVHIWQHWNGISAGLGEGIADAVRAITGHACWGSSAYEFDVESPWDEGYSTTAYFLLWVEYCRDPLTPGFLNKLNATLEKQRWTHDIIPQITADKKELEELWWDYQAFLGKTEITRPPHRLEVAEHFSQLRPQVIRNKAYPNKMVYIEGGNLVLGKPRSLDKKAHLWLVTFTMDGPPYYVLFNLQTNQCFDVFSWSHDDDAKVGVWEGTGGHNQVWTLAKRPHFESNEFYLAARHSHKFLDLNEDDMTLMQKCRDGSKKQIWIIENHEQ
ncbi:hypothetical protein HDU96_003873 [Phlyctochytrium bullatum]|nr:hypothetical protein HDU96_003873 [Phlyctochytrium bullatum]